MGYLYRPYDAHTVWGRLIYRWSDGRMGRYTDRSVAGSPSVVIARTVDVTNRLPSTRNSIRSPTPIHASFSRWPPNPDPRR